ncbi:MAG: hypothetical protein AB7Q16_01505 [Vicinamibacterales bacterium]
MKRLRAEDVKRVVGAASEALTAVLETRSKLIEPDMLNSAGSVSAEWYVETLWHYLAKRSLLQGVSSLDVEFRQPARPADRQLHYAVPHPEADALVMAFHVLRKARDAKRPEKVPVAFIRVNRDARRRRRGVAPDPPYHPYGIEVRRRHLNSLKRVSWHTMVSVIMDVARRGAQFADTRFDRLDRTLLYIVPRFTFTPLADAAAEDNLFIYPEFGLAQPWVKGRTSAAARVTFWAVANEAPWPIAESVVTVVRTSLVDGVRRPVDEEGRSVAKPGAAVA